MYALTLKPPWGFAVRCLNKRIENRSWEPPSSQLAVGEWYAIHNGKCPGGPQGAAARRCRDVAMELLRLYGDNKDLAAVLRNPEYFHQDPVLDSGIVALARHGGVVRQSNDIWFDHQPGNRGWVLEDVIVLPRPIPCSGRQKLWRLPDDIALECCGIIWSQRNLQVWP